MTDETLLGLLKILAREQVEQHIEIDTLNLALTEKAVVSAFESRAAADADDADGSQIGGFQQCYMFGGHRVGSTTAIWSRSSAARSSPCAP